MPSIGKYNKYLRISGEHTVPHLIDIPYPRYIYKNDDSIYEWIEEYEVAKQCYQKTKPKPGSKHPTRPNTYFLEDTELSRGRGTLTQWKRIWMNFPSTTRGRQGYLVTSYEDYNFTVPGRGTGTDTYILAPVSSYSRSGGKLTMIATGHDIVAPMLIRVEYLVIDPISGKEDEHTIVTEALAGTVAGTSVVIDDIVNDKGPAIPRRFRRNDVVQEPYLRKVTCRVEKEHLMLGVNGINSFNDISRPKKYLDIISSVGNRTEILNVDSSPSIEDYEEKIKAKEWIIVEDSTVDNYSDHSPMLVKTIKYVEATW